MTGEPRQGYLPLNELDIEVAPESKSFHWLRCADQIRNQEGCLTKHSSQREMKDGDLTERNGDKEETGERRGAGEERRGGRSWTSL